MKLDALFNKLKIFSLKIKEAFSIFLDKLDRLNNRQLAFIISSFTMCLLLLILLNIQLGAQQQQEALYELSFEEELFEEPPLEEELTLTELETHQAYNEAVKSDYADELDNFKTLEELQQQAQEASSENPSSNESNLDEMALETGVASKYAQRLKEQREKIEALKRRGEAPKINIKRHTTITYSMVDRMHEFLANPVYTCESFGKVVINVRVNASGQVIDANFNRSSSSTSNACLVDNAITYALKSRFEPKPGTSEQLGSITYLFQG